MCAVRNLSKVLINKFLKPSSVWYNELGSKMTVTSSDTVEGTFSGTYDSAVGDAEKDYRLLGQFDTDGNTLGWVVSYKNTYLNAHSTCAWSGHMEMSPGDKEKPIILSTWLMKSQTDPADRWQATNVGFDTFTPDPPKEENVDSAG